MGVAIGVDELAQAPPAEGIELAVVGGPVDEGVVWPLI
jgi:hypothetical protein